MARPTTKEDLLEAAQSGIEKIWGLLDTLPESAKTAEFDMELFAMKKEAHWKRDKNIRDVLIHLYEWQNLALIWVQSNMNGEDRPFLPQPYNWRTYGQMNVELWEKHQITSFDKARELLEKSHAETIKMIEGFTNEELFMKNKFPWTGNNALGSYFVSSTSSHYEWAIKKIKPQIKVILK